MSAGVGPLPHSCPSVLAAGQRNATILQGKRKKIKKLEDKKNL